MSLLELLLKAAFEIVEFCVPVGNDNLQSIGCVLHIVAIHNKVRSTDEKCRHGIPRAMHDTVNVFRSIAGLVVIPRALSGRELSTPVHII